MLKIQPLFSQVLTFIQNRYTTISAWLISRGYTKQTWAAIIAFVSITLITVIYLVSLVFAPPIATFHYEPFASEAEYKQFLKDNPLFLASTPANQPFTLDRKVRGDKIAEYTFTLTTKPLKPDMSPDYLDDYFAVLDNSQQKALDWIKSQNQDPTKLYIRWQPDPISMRQTLLNEGVKQAPIKSTITPTPRPTFAQ